MKFQLEQEQDLSKTPYLTLKQKEFSYSKDGEVASRGDWFFVERNHGIQAVVIVPYIRATDQIVLIRQFRVPFWQNVIEFPAGLIEEGEDISVAAERELREETGLTGQILFQSPPLAVSAGLTTEMASYCIVDVDLERKLEQDLEPMEDIQVFKVQREELYSFCSHMIKKEHCIVDCKVYLSSGILQSVLENPLCKK